VKTWTRATRDCFRGRFGEPVQKGAAAVPEGFADPPETRRVEMPKIKSFPAD
jgi:hypothetical protein